MAESKLSVFTLLAAANIFVPIWILVLPPEITITFEHPSISLQAEPLLLQTGITL